MSHKVDIGVLAPSQNRIDTIDAALVDLLSERMDVVRQVIDIKARHAIPAWLDDRVEAVVAHVRALAAAKNCPPDLTETVWRSMIEWTIAFEERSIVDVATPPHHQEGH